jgi:hypothetical protein
MRRTVGLGLGVVCLLLGGLWFLQGVGVVGGSFMTGSRRWLFIGLIVALAGIGLITTGLRGRRGG